MFTKVAIPIFIYFFAFSSCNRGADNNKQIPEAYPNGKRFYVESKLKKSNSDSTTTLKFYHPNGVLSEKQDLDENDLLLRRILYDEEGLLLQTIDYTHFYDGEYDILHHTFSGNGLKWQDIITIREFDKNGNVRALTNRSIRAYADPQGEGEWERYTSIEDSVTRYYANGKLKETSVTEDGRYIRTRRLYDENERMILEAKFGEQ